MGQTHAITKTSGGHLLFLSQIDQEQKCLPRGGSRLNNQKTDVALQNKNNMIRTLRRTALVGSLPKGLATAGLTHTQ